MDGSSRPTKRFRGEVTGAAEDPRLVTSEQMRKRRFIPENKDGVLVEISCRTIGGLAMLRPSRKLPEVIAGVLGRALELSPLEIVVLFFASNHFLCSAEHKKCYVEHPVMWSCPTLFKRVADIGGGDST